MKQVRFPDWQNTKQGEPQVQQVLGRTLLKYRLHKDQELFDKAFGYIREYYSGRVGVGESWGGAQQSESRRSPAGQGMRFGNGGVGERAGCCGLKSALRGSHSGECAYWNAGERLRRDCAANGILMP